MSEVVMRSPSPRASDRVRKFMDLFLARLVDDFEGSSEEELVAMNPKKEKKPDEHRQRLLSELDGEGPESDFIRTALTEVELDEETM